MGDRARGTLHLVGTPIGNLGDLTLRAIETLRQADRVAAEDTRRTRALLTHLGITGKTLVSLDANASLDRINALLDQVEGGEDVAFATDAGMPAVSDPGAALVRAATARGLSVTVVPGPSAVTTAVTLSGLVDSPYLFVGFLPRRGKKRSEAIAELAKTAVPVVIFEAPNRTAETLSELAESMPDRSVAVCRELTKLHEETVRGKLGDVAEPARNWRGEIVIVLGASQASAEEAPSESELDERIDSLLAGGRSTKDVVSELGAWSGLAKRELYARVQARKSASD